MYIFWRQAVPVPLAVAGEFSLEDIKHNKMPKGICGRVIWRGGIVLSGRLLCTGEKKEVKYKNNSGKMLECVKFIIL